MPKPKRTYSVVCTHCLRRDELPRRGFAWPGLPKYECRVCGEKFLYPMTVANRVLMFVFLAWMAVAVVMIVGKGGIPVPGLLGVFLIWGIIRDHGVRADVTDSEAREAAGERPTIAPRAS